MRELIEAPLKRCIPMDLTEWQELVERQYSQAEGRVRPRGKGWRATIKPTAGLRAKFGLIEKAAAFR